MRRVLFLTLTILVSTGGLESQQLAKWKQRLVATGYAVGVNPLNPNSVYAQNNSGVLAVSYDRGRTWSLRSPMPGQMMREILINSLDTNVILCAAFTGGLHRSQDGGMTWTTVIPGFGIDGESIALNPAHPDTVFAGDYATTNVYRSTDRGISWTQMGTVGGAICAFTVRPDSTNIIYTGAGAGRIAKTTDYGATWRIVKPGGSEEIPKIVIDRLHPMTAYAAAYEGPDSTEGVWKTVDGGEHWFKTSLQARSIWSLDIDRTNSSIVYAGTFAESTATVYVTSDGGSSWISRPSGIAVYSNAWNIKVHPLDGSAVWLAEEGTNGGVYQYLSTTTIVQGAVLDSATGDTISNGWVINTSTLDTVSLASSRGTFTFGFFPDDSNLTPTLRFIGYPYYVTDVAVSFVRDSTLIHDVRLQRLARANITGTVRDSLTLQPVGGRVRLLVSTMEGPGALTDTADQYGAFAFNGMYISQPPVVQYDGMAVDPDIPHPHVDIPPFTLTASGADFSLHLGAADLFIVCADTGRFGEYYQTVLDSLGVTWNMWNRTSPAPLTEAARFRKRAVILYTGNRGTPFSLAEDDSLQACIALGENLMLTGQNIAEDNDTTTLLRNVLGVRFGGNVSPLASASGVPNDIFSSLNFGLLGAGGANNQSSKDRLTIVGAQTRECLVYNNSGGTAAIRKEPSGKIVFMGFGFEGINNFAARRAVMQRVIGYFDGPTSVNENDGQAPLAFRLEQNYPNPFNPGTEVGFEVAEGGFVSLKVYDLLGREVATLVGEIKQPGGYSVRWSAGGLASGVYFCRLTAGPHVETRKMVVLR